MEKLNIKAVFAAIFCNVLFGSAFPMIKLGYEYMHISGDVFSNILYAGVRFFISGAILFIIAAILGKKLPTVTKGNRKTVLLLALTYTFLQYLFFYVGLSNTSGATGSVVNSSSVFIAVILAHFIYPSDRLNAKKVIGSLVGFIGVSVACFANGGIGSLSFLGEGFVLIGTTFFVIGAVFNKKAAGVDGSFTASAYNLLIGGALLIAVGLIGFDGQLTVTPMGILVLAYLCLVSSVGFTLWSMLLKKYPIGKLSVYNFVIPVSGAIFSAIVLNEKIFTWQYALALVLVSAGIITVNYTKSKKHTVIFSAENL